MGFMFTPAKLRVMSGLVDWGNDNIRVLLVEDGFVPSQNTRFLNAVAQHELLYDDEGPGTTRVPVDGRSVATDGDSVIWVADNVVWDDLLGWLPEWAMPNVGGAVIYIEAFDDSVSEMLLWIPLVGTLTGQDVYLTFDPDGVARFE